MATKSDIEPSGGRRSERTGESLRRLFLPEGRADRRGLVIEDAVLDPDGVRVVRRARLRSNLERMALRHQITGRQFAAAGNLYRDYAFGVEGATTDAPGSADGADPHGLGDARLFAIRRVNDAAAALGKRLCPLVFSIVVWDMTLEHVAQHNAARRRELAVLLRHGLDLLADVYRLPEE